MGAYSKLIGALLGNVIAMVVVYLGTKGLATCTGVGDAETCTVAGFTTAQITAAVLSVFNMAFVYFFPANKATS